MSRLSLRLPRLVRARAGAVVLAAALGAAGVALAPPAARATPVAAPTRYFLTLGGTCDPTGSSYDGVDLRGGVRVRVTYPASVGTWLLCNDRVPFQRSVNIGVAAAREALLATYARDPQGEFVLVGYSQGAEVVSLLLADIADGKVAVPPAQVRAKLYADPMQPVTGIGATVPKGLGVPIIDFVSPGPGRATYAGGIRYTRYCIVTDGVCDTRRPLLAALGYFTQHPQYPAKFFGTIADGVYLDAVQWLPKQ